MCDPGVEYSVVEAKEEPECHYTVVMRSKFACRECGVGNIDLSPLKSSINGANYSAIDSVRVSSMLDRHYFS